MGWVQMPKMVSSFDMNEGNFSMRHEKKTIAFVMGFEAFERTEIRDFGCKNFRPKWISADRIFGL